MDSVASERGPRCGRGQSHPHRHSAEVPSAQAPARRTWRATARASLAVATLALAVVSAAQDRREVIAALSQGRPDLALQLLADQLASAPGDHGLSTLQGIALTQAGRPRPSPHSSERCGTPQTRWPRSNERLRSSSRAEVRERSRVWNALIPSSPRFRPLMPCSVSLRSRGMPARKRSGISEAPIRHLRGTVWPCGSKGSACSWRAMREPLPGFTGGC